MGYGLTYRMKFTNQEGFDIVALIQDTTTFDPLAEEYIKELTPAGDPLRIQIIDTNEDKYTPIKSKSAIIQVLSDVNINVSLFALNSTDNRWKVDIYVDNPLNPLFLGEHHPLFTGFLILNDLSEPFLDATDRQVITLTASDGLGLLKDIPLTDIDENNPKGKFTIVQYVAWCLQKTGLQLDINVMNNLMEESFIGLPAWNNIKIDAKTFEDQLNQIFTRINCYEVLTRILGEECFLGQWKSQWWIKRIDEIEDNLNYYDTYNYLGIYSGSAHDINFIKNIGLDQPIQLVAPATNVLFERPYHHIQEAFDLQLPIELIDNIDFSRSLTDIIAPLVVDVSLYLKVFATKSAFPGTGQNGIVYKATDTGKFYKWNGFVYIETSSSDVPSGTAYVLEDWTPGVYLSVATPPTDAAYLVRIFIAGYEKERYVQLKQPDGRVYFIQCNPVFLDYKDKFTISVDTRLSANVGGGSGFRRAGVMQVRFYGDDGTFYFLHGPTSVDPTPRWVTTNSTFSINTDFVYIEDQVSDDETQWITASCEAPPLPVGGYIVVWLINWGPNVGFAAATHFINLSFSPSFYINGSYAKYNSQYSKVYKNTIDLKAKRENQVYISDSPRKLFKGALFKTIAGKDLLTGNWVNGAITALRSEPVDPQFKHPLGYIQAYSIWNQYLREMRMLDFNALGLDSGTDIPDLFHNYIFSDYSPHVFGKKFLLNYYEQDLYLCRWKGHFKEVFDFQKQKAYNDLFEFKYLEK